MSRKRVLFVDDQQSIQKVGEQILISKGFDVTIADGGRKALTFFSQTTFDLIILDYFMPQMNGMEVLLKIKAYPNPQKRNTPILILSSEENPKMIKSFFENGANDFIQKTRLASTPELFLEKVFTLTNQKKEAVAYKKEKLRKTVPDIVKKFHTFTNRVIQNYIAASVVEMNQIEQSFEYLHRQISEGELLTLVYELPEPDDYLVTHTVNCTLLTMMFSHNALHWNEEKTIAVGIGAFFHDFGYLDWPNLFFTSPNNLQKEQYEYYLGHVGRSLAIAEKFGLKKESIEFIANHHEHNDGSGFPGKKMEKDIGEVGEIAAIINSFDALTFPDNLHEKHQSHDAIKKMRSMEGAFSEDYLNRFSTFIRQFDFKPHD